MMLDNSKSLFTSVSSASTSSFEMINYSYLTDSFESSKVTSNNNNNNNNDNIANGLRKMLKPSTSTAIQTSITSTVKSESSDCRCPSEIRKQLNDELRYFFKNPMDKWRETRAFPWKLFLQFVKLIIVTIHIVSIGFEMSSFILKDNAMEATLRALLFEDYDTDLELNTYPPAQGPYAVYTKANFYSNTNFVIKSLGTLEDEGINLFAYSSESRDQVSPINLHIREFVTSNLDPFSGYYDINPREVTRFIPIDVDYPAGDIAWDDFDLQSYLAQRNETLNFNQIIDLEIVTYLRTIFFHSLTSYYYSPACYLVKVMVNYDNSAHCGQIIMSLSTESFIQKCYGNVLSNEVTLFNTYLLVTWIVLIISTVSFFLCCRSIKFAWILWMKVSEIAKTYYGTKLTADEDWVFFDTGLAVIMVNDLIFILASIIKLSGTIQLDENIKSANRFSLLYGVGILLTWCNLLRYLNLFERFNVVTRTIQKASVDIFKFTLVTSMIFTGYALSGWLVLGPYHLKFTTLSQTCECLFSLINGDDMFVTFASVDLEPGTNGAVIWWFSRIYLYSFVSLFIYFILNLFITIIIEARDNIQNCFDNKHRDQRPFLQKFMGEPEE